MKKIQNPNKLSSYFKAEKMVLLAITISGIIYNFGMSAGPFFEGLLVQMLADIMSGKKGLNDMVTLALIYVGVICVIQFSRSVKRFCVRRFANNVSRNMRHTLYHHLISMPYMSLKENNVGELMTKAISDVDACVEGMRKFTTEIFDTGVVLVVYLSVMLVYDWRLTLLSCCFIPLAYYFANGLKKKITNYHRNLKKEISSLNNATMDRIEHVLIYRIHGLEKQRAQAYETQLERVEKSAIQANVWESSMKPIYHMISMTGVMFLLYFGVKNVLGSGNVSWNLAAFTTYLSCFTKMAVKSSSAAKLMNAIQKAQVSWVRIKPLMHLDHVIKEETSFELSQSVNLEIKDLSVGYDEKIIIDHFNLNALAGEIIGISGTVASGKSTLGKAFLFEPIVQGEILVNGHNLKDLTPKQRSKIIGYMGHESELLADTVENNITLGENQSIQTVFDLVGLSQEMQPSTFIGEEGAKLSGGQKARLALARTLYHEKPILILDDPFASVDLENETRMIQEIKTMAQNQIILLFSHRLTHFASFDQIVWIEEGKAQVSTHQKLMRENATYAKIMHMQKGEDDEK